MARFVAGLIDPAFANFSVVFFLVLFVLCIGWVYRPGRRKEYQHVSELPLVDDEADSNVGNV